MHPVLFEIPTPRGVLPIYGFGTMLGGAVLVAWWLILRAAPREGVTAGTASRTFVVSLLAGLLGGRLAYIVLLHAGNPDAAALGQGGMSSYGALLFGLVGAWASLRGRGTSLTQFADLAAPPLALGFALTRLGCWLHGCDFGQPLSEGAPGWLARLGTFPRWSFDPNAAMLWGGALEGSPAWNWHVQTGGLDSSSPLSLPVHPTELYEALVGFTLFVLATLLVGRRTFRGQVALGLGLLYALARFGLEALRDDPGRGSLFGLSAAQVSSVVLFGTCAYLYAKGQAHSGSVRVEPS